MEKRSTYVQQRRYARAIDISVENSGGDSQARAGQGDVGGNCTFADAAFGTADSDGFGHVGDWALFGEASFHAGGEVGGRA